MFSLIKQFILFKWKVSYVLPDTFAEQYIRVYSSIEHKTLIDVTEKSFAEWCIENGIPQPKVILNVYQLFNFHIDTLMYRLISVMFGAWRPLIGWSWNLRKDFVVAVLWLYLVTKHVSFQYV